MCLSISQVRAAAVELGYVITRRLHPGEKWQTNFCDIWVAPNWVLFISRKEAGVKGQLSSGCCSFSHFCESLPVPSYNKQRWEEIDNLLHLTIYSNMCV